MIVKTRKQVNGCDGGEKWSILNQWDDDQFWGGLMTKRIPSRNGNFKFLTGE